jgi:thiol-disulfide isomerase/thioredoxin
MKKLLIFSFLFTLVFSSCSKKGGTDTGGTSADKPVLKLTKSAIVADGFDETVISVVDKNGNDITTQCYITGNGTQITDFTYFTTAAGSISLNAKLGSVSALPVTLNCSAPPASPFTKKVLAEDYTGAWCGYCPRVGRSLELASASNPNIFPVAVHNADPFAYSLEAAMRSRWGVSGFPTAIINRNITWNENTSVLTGEASKWAPLGLSIESSIAGNVVSGKVKTKFNVTTSVPLTITIMLTEDGKILAQRNYMNADPGPFFGLGDPIVNYVHNHILRMAATDIFGDAIPSASVIKDNIYEKTYSFNTSGYDLTKCDVVAVVSYADGLPYRKGALNVQKVRAGSVKAFD